MGTLRFNEVGGLIFDGIVPIEELSKERIEELKKELTNLKSNTEVINNTSLGATMAFGTASIICAGGRHYYSAALGSKEPRESIVSLSAKKELAAIGGGAFLTLAFVSAAAAFALHRSAQRMGKKIAAIKLRMRSITQP